MSPFKELTNQLEQKAEELNFFASQMVTFLLQQFEYHPQHLKEPIATKYIQMADNLETCRMDYKTIVNNITTAMHSLSYFQKPDSSTRKLGDSSSRLDIDQETSTKRKTRNSDLKKEFQRNTSEKCITFNSAENSYVAEESLKMQENLPEMFSEAQESDYAK